MMKRESWTIFAPSVCQPRIVTICPFQIIGAPRPICWSVLPRRLFPQIVPSRPTCRMVSKFSSGATCRAMPLLSSKYNVRRVMVDAELGQAVFRPPENNAFIKLKALMLWLADVCNPDSQHAVPPYGSPPATLT